MGCQLTLILMGVCKERFRGHLNTVPNFPPVGEDLEGDLGNRHEKHQSLLILSFIKLGYPGCWMR